MEQGQHTIAAVATAPGMGGIAVIRISGSDAHKIAEKIFVPVNKQKKISELPGYVAAFGYFENNDGKIDEGVALSFREPHSYTGEDVVELSCHGGTSVTSQILSEVIKAGAVPASAGEFTRRAVLNGRLSLTQAEAVMDMISATSRVETALARSGMAGKLQDDLLQMKKPLVELAGHLTAWTDYPEEDVEELTAEKFVDTVTMVKNRLDELIIRSQQGAVLQRGVQTVIAGSPNVGKSTLFNLLTGYEHAIVTPLAGTTRDVVRQQIQLDGITLQLADTAGLHQTEDVVEKEGIKRSYDEIDTAGLVIFVFDSSQKWDESQKALAEKCKGRPALGILNKSDLGVVLTKEELSPFFSEVITISAKSGDEAVDSIKNSIMRILKLENIDTDSAILANNRQLSTAIIAKEALENAAKTMQDGFTLDAAGVFLDDALHAIAVLSGEEISETILEEVFSKFCVGK